MSSKGVTKSINKSTPQQTKASVSHDHKVRQSDLNKLKQYICARLDKIEEMLTVMHPKETKRVAFETDNKKTPGSKKQVVDEEEDEESSFSEE
jgi:hypothetical protein